MPELPELEIVARRVGGAVEGAEVESVAAPGLNAVKTFEPPLSAVEGAKVREVGRRGKLLILGFGELAAVIHLMSAGRFQLWDKRAGPRDRTSRVLFRLSDGRELRLREFGTKQRAWLKLMPAAAVADDPDVAKLGPEAWPEPPPLAEALAVPRPLHSVLRDQRMIAGIGRSWADKILWEARLSPFKRGGDLSEEEAERLRGAIVAVLGGAVDHYERELALPLPDKFPMPLKVHRRNGEPCPRCGEEIAAVHFEDYVIGYCPAEQTGGRRLKDRRLSRLLK